MSEKKDKNLHPVFTLTVLAVAFGLVYLGFAGVNDGGTSRTEQKKVDSPPSRGTGPMVTEKMAQVNDDRTELVARCAKEAAVRGYQSPSCAWPFINKCVTTGSKEEMDKFYNFSLSMGGHQIKEKGVCSAYVSEPSMSEYSGAFKKAYKVIKNEL